VAGRRRGSLGSRWWGSAGSPLRQPAPGAKGSGGNKGGAKGGRVVKGGKGLGPRLHIRSSQPYLDKDRCAWQASVDVHSAAWFCLPGAVVL
jgi:hypothetical protein